MERLTLSMEEQLLVKDKTTSKLSQQWWQPSAATGCWSITVRLLTTTESRPLHRLSPDYSELPPDWRIFSTTVEYSPQFSPLASHR